MTSAFLNILLFWCLPMLVLVATFLLGLRRSFCCQPSTDPSPKTPPRKESKNASTQEVAVQHFGEGAYDGWQLAREIGGQNWMRIYVRVRGGELGFRVQASADASMEHFLCMLQEWDLVPRWISYAKDTGILSQPRTDLLFLYADFGWRPLPLPSMHCVLEAHVAQYAALPDETLPEGSVVASGQPNLPRFLVTAASAAADEPSRGRGACRRK